MKIPIKKTNRKVPVSIWSCDINFNKQKIGNNNAIKDIKPIYTVKLNKNTEIKSTDKDLIDFMKPKPSLWQRVFRRVK